MPSLYIGTSAFTAAGWEGSFYPEGTKPADFLRYYAQHFNSVEIDSTFYRISSASMVRGWASKAPVGFVFAAKVPQVITHEKVLVDSEAEFKEFAETMDLLIVKISGCFAKKNHEIALWDSQTQNKPGCYPRHRQIHSPVARWHGISPSIRTCGSPPTFLSR
jgi:hypothetical protein